MKRVSKLHEPGPSGSTQLTPNISKANSIDTGVVECRLRSFISTPRMSLQQRRTTGQSQFCHRATLTRSLTHRTFSTTLSAFARIENHYFVNDGFMREGQLLDQQEIDKM